MVGKGGRESQTGAAIGRQSKYNPAMLKRLYIDNFRCFVNFEYKPERKQLLLGANGSGKSSLLDAIEAVKAFVGARGSVFESSEQRTFQASKTRWLNLPSQIFEIEAEIGGAQYLYRLENDVSHPSPFSSVIAETLKVDGAPVVEVVKGEATLYTLAGPSSARFGVGNNASSLAVLTTNRKEIRTFVEWLVKKVFCLRVNPFSMSSLGELDDKTHPRSDLSDIASWYLQLAGSDVEAIIKLRDSLKEVLSGFAALQFPGQQGGAAELRGTFSSQGKEMSLALNELSEGQRCLTALYMVLHFVVAKGQTVFLDEPDNFVSLREIQPWLLAAEQAVEDSGGQLILISHHPEILNYWAKEFGLLFFREENGHARTKPYSSVPDTGLEPAETIARGWEDE